MKRKVTKHKELDRVSSYAMGLLGEAETADFEKHLATGCAVCLRELNAVNNTLGLLHLAGPIAALPALCARAGSRYSVRFMRHTCS
jgi:hypothetical protein